MCTEDIDRIIYTEIPDKDSDPLTFEIVIRHMIHVSCATNIPYVSRMDDDSCTKHYPKSFCDETIIVMEV